MFVASRPDDGSGALQPVDGEQVLRVYGPNKYETSRELLLRNEAREGQAYWQGQVALEVKTIEGQAGKSDTKNLIAITHDGVEIGELSEFDSVANAALDFTPKTKYSGRVVIHRDFIGSIVHLFVDPKTRRSQK